MTDWKRNKGKGTGQIVNMYHLIKYIWRCPPYLQAVASNHKWTTCHLIPCCSDK